MRNVLEEMGLPTGPWLNILKELILAGAPSTIPLDISWRDGDGREHRETFPLGYLHERVVKEAPGRRVAYITDCAYTPENERKIVELAAQADILFIESAFLQEDEKKAAARNHLTAAQAGALARKAQVKRFILFHFSPKYKGRQMAFRAEAEAAFHPASPPHPVCDHYQEGNVGSQ